MTISELSELYYQVQNAFDAVRTGEVGMSEATSLQAKFEKELESFQTNNPDVPLFIDAISRSVVVKDILADSSV